MLSKIVSITSAQNMQMDIIHNTYERDRMTKREREREREGGGGEGGRLKKITNGLNALCNTRGHANKRTRTRQ